MAEPSSPVPAGLLLDGAWTERLPALSLRVARQYVRSRAHGMAVVLVPIVGLGLATLLLAWDDVDGRTLAFPAAVLLWALLVAVVDPLLVAVEHAGERRSDAWDLLRLTGQRPLPVAAGLLGGAALRGILISALLAPLLVLTWIVGEVELLTLLRCVVLIPACALAAYALGLRAACAPARVPWRLGALGLLLAGIWLGAAVAGATELVGRRSIPGWLSWMDLPSFDGTALGGMWLTVAWAAVGFAILATLDTAERGEPGTDGAVAQRVASALIWLGLWLSLLLPQGEVVSHYRQDLSAATIAALAAELVLAWCGIHAVAEHAGVPRPAWRHLTDPAGRVRVRRAPPRRRWFGLLDPGRAGSCRCFVLLALGQTLAVGIAFEPMVGFWHLLLLVPLLGLLEASCLLVPRRDEGCHRPWQQRRVALALLAAIPVLGLVHPLLLIPYLFLYPLGMVGGFLIWVRCLETMYPIVVRRAEPPDRRVGRSARRRRARADRDG